MNENVFQLPHYIAQDEDLSGWKLVRNIDGQDRPEFPFQGITLEPLQKIKVGFLAAYFSILHLDTTYVLCLYWPQ